MATLFQLPRTAPLYAGSSLASSKLYFFQSGTLTPITTYTTSALSVAHTHPVVADGEGVFPAIFLNPTVNATYRVQLKTLADVLKYDEDNLQTAQESVDVQWTFNAQVKGTYSSDATGAAFLAQSLIPAYRWYRSAAATDEKVWEARANIASWSLLAMDDAHDFGQSAIQVNRSGAAVDGVYLFADTTTLGVNASGLNVSATSEDRMDVNPQAAGSGIRLRALNNGGTDYEPFALYAETVDLQYRTGAGTAASAADINTSGQLSLAKKFYPAQDTGAKQTAAAVMAGTGVPDNGNGANGDFYLRGDGTVAGNTIVYHKQGGSWVAMNTTVRTLPNYISGTGTAGIDNTAQTVVTLGVAANSLTQVGDRMRVRSYWRGDTGSNITGTLALNGVTIGTNTDSGGASFQTQESWLHYVDNTHANIMSSNSSGWDSAISAVNVAGFDWSASQNITVAQDMVANNHIVVFFVAADVYLKAV